MQAAAVSWWNRESPPTGEMMRSLRELNCGFLELKGVGADRLAALSAAQKTAVANCPYALFDLRFFDDGHWQRRVQSARAWRVADAPPVDDDVAAFAQLALFYAWHVAASARTSARLLLGMHERTAAAFGNITVDRLPALALTESANLAARFRHCESYWSALVEAATSSDRASLRRVQLYGLQLAVAAQLPCRQP